MKRLLTVFGVAGLAMASFAAVNDTLISFSTPGVDTYADGTAVRDGECYALVWSADGVFEGLDVNGRPLDAADAVVLVAPVARIWSIRWTPRGRPRSRVASTGSISLTRAGRTRRRAR